MTDITVMATYTRKQMTMAERMTYETVWGTVKRDMTRSARK